MQKRSQIGKKKHPIRATREFGCSKVLPEADNWGKETTWLKVPNLSNIILKDLCWCKNSKIATYWFQDYSSCRPVEPPAYPRKQNWPTSQQFHLYKLLGSCGLFCNKDKGIITQPDGTRQKRSDQIKHSAGAHALMQPNPTQARIPGPTNSTSAGVHSLTQLSPAQARFRVGQISLKRAEQIVRKLFSNRQWERRSPMKLKRWKKCQLIWRKPDVALPDATNFMLYWFYLLCDFVHKRKKQKTQKIGKKSRIETLISEKLALNFQK